MAINTMSVLELWKKRNFERIDQEAKNKLIDVLTTDNYTHDLIIYMNKLRDEGFKVEMPGNIYVRISDENREKKELILKQAENEKKQINRTIEEINALLKVCNGDSEKEMEILCSYRIVEYPFGRMVVGGSICGR